MIFVSDFLRADVVDVDQRTVGSVRDLIVHMEEPYPSVTAVAIRGRSKELPATIDWGAVRAGEGGELSLNVPTSALRPHPHADGEIWLARDVLDKQIVDTDGRRVVRVNDLQLQPQDGKMLLVGVDIGARGLLRRLGDRARGPAGHPPRRPRFPAASDLLGRRRPGAQRRAQRAPANQPPEARQDAPG